jgi:ComF family protein
MASWTQVIHRWLNVILQSNCPLCQRAAFNVFCIDCQRQLERCRLPDPKQGWQGDLPVFAWGTYQGPLKRAIAALKYSQQLEVAHPLGQWLGQSWLIAPPIGTVTHNFIVVPIPLHAIRQQQRGYNQAERLAESFCNYTGLRLERHALKRIQETKAQFSLSIEQRTQNLASAFAVNQAVLQQVRHNHILLFDDIYTTGATVRSAAQAFQNLGCSVAGVIALAFTPLTPSRSINPDPPRRGTSVPSHLLQKRDMDSIQ